MEPVGLNIETMQIWASAGFIVHSSVGISTEKKNIVVASNLNCWYLDKEKEYCCCFRSELLVFRQRKRVLLLLQI